VHPLTGQLYVADRSDTLQAEIDLVAPGANGGWPCLEGGDVSSGGVAACLAGHTKDEVYANHPSWSRPIVAHTGNPQVTGLAVSTSLGYPEEFYGDVFYLLRDSARIYRIDLQPPCFMPSGTELAPLVFHDSNRRQRLPAIYDIDGDDDFDNVGLSTLSAITQGAEPDRHGRALRRRQAGERLHRRLRHLPHRVRDHVHAVCGPRGSRARQLLAGIENPFARPACLVPSGACAGQPDGTSCDDGDSCNGTDACQGGACVHSGNAADGTSCAGTGGCSPAGTCQSGAVRRRRRRPDGTPCARRGSRATAPSRARPASARRRAGPALFDVKSVDRSAAAAARSHGQRRAGGPDRALVDRHGRPDDRRRRRAALREHARASRERSAVGESKPPVALQVQGRRRAHRGRP
jgi:hypothetical protein